MNHAGEITPLVGFVRPHVALVTTIAPVHIEYLGSLEAIADAKAEIFTGLEPGGVAVLNRDAPQFERLERSGANAAARACARSARGEDCDARLIDFEPRGEGSLVRARLHGREIDFTLGAPGRHMAENALGVLLVVEALGASVEKAAAALAEFAPAKGRGERFVLGGAERPLHRHRRKLQRQPGLDARGAGAAGRDEAGAGRPSHRGDRRHAGAGRRGRRSARRARAGTRRRASRSAVRRRAADARAVRRGARRDPRRLGREPRPTSRTNSSAACALATW